MKIEIEDRELRKHSCQEMPVGVPFRTGQLDVYMWVRDPEDGVNRLLCLTNNELVCPDHVFMREGVIPLTVTATARDNPEWRNV